MSLQERVPSSTVTSEQYRDHAVPTNEQGREEGEIHLGTPYLVPRSDGGHTLMYQSPHRIFEKVENNDGETELRENTDIMMLVGAEVEAFYDTDINAATGEVSRKETRRGLPSLLVSKEDFTPEKQQALTQSLGFNYGVLLNTLPKDDQIIKAEFQRIMHEESVRMVGRGALGVVHR